LKVERSFERGWVWAVMARTGNGTALHVQGRAEPAIEPQRACGALASRHHQQAAIAGARLLTNRGVFFFPFPIANASTKSLFDFS